MCLSEAFILECRPQDGLTIERMLKSRDRQNWDLRIMAWEACEAASRSLSVRLNTGTG